MGREGRMAREIHERKTRRLPFWEKGDPGKKTNPFLATTGKAKRVFIACEKV